MNEENRSEAKRRRLSFRMGAGAAVVLAGILAGILVVGAASSGRQTALIADVAQPLDARFELVTDDGLAVTQADFRGKPGVWFFGFTHCPDVCPTTLFALGELLQELGPDADRLTPVFVTVDPERDTWKVLADYMQPFDPHLVALTGAREDIDTVLGAFDAYSRKVPLGSGEYTMDHTSRVYLLDAQGRLAGTLDHRKAAKETTLAELRRLVAGGP